MGLITKKVEINITPRNISRYKQLGYDLPYPDIHGYAAKVLTKDLSKNSTVKVIVECDICHNQKEIAYRDYANSRSVNKYGEYICYNCKGNTLVKERSPNWDNSKTQQERELKRHTPEYKQFAKNVLVRDNYTCQKCGHKSSELIVHHLNGYSWFQEGRTDETNGVTLCKKCHNEFHSLYSRNHNTKEQFEEWIEAKVDYQQLGVDILDGRPIYCIEENKVYKNASELSRLWDVPLQNVYRVCNDYDNSYSQRYSTLKGKHLIWRDIAIQLTEKQLQQYCINNPKGQSKVIISIFDNKIYATIKDLNEAYGLGQSSYSSYRYKHKTKYAYIEKYNVLAMPFNDFINLADDEIQDLSIQFHLPNLIGQINDYK